MILKSEKGRILRALKEVTMSDLASVEYHRAERRHERFIKECMAAADYLSKEFEKERDNEKIQ